MPFRFQIPAVSESDGTRSTVGAPGVCLPVPVRGLRGVALGWQGRGGRHTGVVRRPTITPPGEMRRRVDPDRNREARPSVVTVSGPAAPRREPDVRQGRRGDQLTVVALDPAEALAA